MLKQAFFCNINSIEGITLSKIVEFIFGQSFVAEGLEVRKIDGTKISISPGRAVVVYPLILVENTEEALVDIAQLDPDCSNDGYHVVGILCRDNRQTLFTVIPQVAENEWKTTLDNFVILAIVRVESGNITEINHEYKSFKRHDKSLAFLRFDTFGFASVTSPNISGPTQVSAGSTISLSASGSITAFADSGASIVHYEWQLPDGSVSTGESLDYTTTESDANKALTFKCRAVDTLGNKSVWTTHTVAIVEELPE